MPKVIAIGTPVSDYLLNVPFMPKPNQSCRLLSQSWQYGGKSSTAIVTVGRQGIEAAICGVVGDDANGRAQIKDFNRHGVDTSHLIVDPEVDTAACVGLSDLETGGRSFLGGLAKPRAIKAEELDEDFIKSADYLLLDTNSDATRLAATWMKEKGGEVMFDADGYSEAIEAMIPYSTIFVPSEFYYTTRYGDRDPIECCREMKAQGPHTVIITLGEKGCVGVGPDDVAFTLPCFKVNVIDTTGAGDTFHGAYVVAQIRGLNPEESARWASATSAIKCTAIGGRAGQPTVEMVEKFLATGEIDTEAIAERVKYYSQPPF